jgi:hypothetical protein
MIRQERTLYAIDVPGVASLLRRADRREKCGREFNRIDATPRKTFEAIVRTRRSGRRGHLRDLECYGD